MRVEASWVSNKNRAGGRKNATGHLIETAYAGVESFSGEHLWQCLIATDDGKFITVDHRTIIDNDAGAL